MLSFESRSPAASKKSPEKPKSKLELLPLVDQILEAVRRGQDASTDHAFQETISQLARQQKLPPEISQSPHTHQQVLETLRQAAKKNPALGRESALVLIAETLVHGPQEKPKMGVFERKERRQPDNEDEEASEPPSEPPSAPSLRIRRPRGGAGSSLHL